MKTTAIITESSPITGTEVNQNDGTPHGALVQFYAAFNGRDLNLMEQNWLQSPESAMDNPLGGIMRGWENIAQVYRRIFEGQAQVYVEFYDYSIHEQGDSFFAVGRERGQFTVNGLTINLAIRTSRIFKKENGKWEQVHHHGSIEDPTLLAEYQRLVKG